MKNKSKVIPISCIIALCISSIPVYANEEFTASKISQENNAEIFSSGDKIDIYTAEDGTEGLFTDRDAEAANSANSIIQNGIVYEEYGNGTLNAIDYTEELNGVTRISIPVQVNGKVVSGIREGCFQGLENIEAIEIPGSVTRISKEILENWEGITLFCSAGSSASAMAERGGIVYDTSTMPTTYYEDGNGVVYLFDWEEMAYTAGTIDIANFTGKKSIVYKNEIDGYPVISIDSEKLAKRYLDDQTLCFNYVTEIVIPDGIKEIAQGEFSPKLCFDFAIDPDTIGLPELGYTNLTRVIFEEGETPINLNKNIFSNCNSLTEVQFSSRVRELPENTFINCPALTKLELPEGMTKIGQAALQGVPNLEYLYIPSSVTEIADDAMDGLEKLTVYGEKNSYAEYYCRLHQISFEAEGTIEPEQPYLVHSASQISNHTLYFTVGLLRDVEGAEGYEFQSLASDGKTVLRTKKSATYTTVLRNAPNDIYVRGRYWKQENGQKIYSPWSNTEHLYMEIKGGNMTLSKAAVSGKTVTLTFADNVNFFQESDGYDCKLQNVNGNAGSYMLRNQKYRTIRYSNVKKGTYYVIAKAYKLVNGKKYYGESSNTRKVVVK